jgi:hypothetical protein
MGVGSGSRLLWQDLPPAVRREIASRGGTPVLRAVSQEGGFTSGLAARLLLADGRRVFVKGIPGDHPLAGMYEEEAAVEAAVPTGFSSPALLWSGRSEGWILLLFDDVDGRHPSLAPGSADLPAVLDTVALMEKALSPCAYAGARPVAEALARFRAVGGRWPPIGLAISPRGAWHILLTWSSGRRAGCLRRRVTRCFTLICGPTTWCASTPAGPCSSSTGRSGIAGPRGSTPYGLSST